MIELCVVIVIMATLAGVAIQAATNATADASASATLAQLTTMRQSIVGAADGAGIACYRRDCGGVPMFVADLVAKPDSVPAFAVGAGSGWRGPYLFVPRARYLHDDARGFTLRYVRPASHPPTPPLPEDEPAVLDGWGRPIVLQFPDVNGNDLPPHTADELKHARLVSAGENGVIDTPADLAPGNLAETVHFPAILPSNDDLVLYLHVADLRYRIP